MAQKIELLSLHFSELAYLPGERVNYFRLSFALFIKLKKQNNLICLKVQERSTYSRVRNKHTGTVINFLRCFPGATSLLKGATIIDF